MLGFLGGLASSLLGGGGVGGLLKAGAGLVGNIVRPVSNFLGGIFGRRKSRPAPRPTPAAVPQDPNAGKPQAPATGVSTTVGGDAQAAQAAGGGGAQIAPVPGGPNEGFIGGKVREGFNNMVDNGSNYFLAKHGLVAAPWVQQGISWGAKKLFDAAVRPFGAYLDNIAVNHVMPLIAPGQSPADVYSQGLKMINQFNKTGQQSPSAPPTADQVERTQQA